MKKLCAMGQYPIDSDYTRFMQGSTIPINDIKKWTTTSALQAGVTNLDGILDGVRTQFTGGDGYVDGITHYAGIDGGMTNIEVNGPAKPNIKTPQSPRPETPTDSKRPVSPFAPKRGKFTVYVSGETITIPSVQTRGVTNYAKTIGGAI